MTQPHDPIDEPLDEPLDSPHPGARHRPLRELLHDAAIEAEMETGRREKTEEEARHSMIQRIARLVAGWLLVLLGLAGLVLPGPGWLIVLLGLTLLPYRWTDNLIRIIRRRIPGIPEDGRIPTRTWVVMGLAVALTTGASIWWGLRDKGDDSPGDDRASAQDGSADGARDDRSGAAEVAPIVAAAIRDDADRGQLAALYAHVAAEVDGADADLREVDDPCAELTGGRADLMVASGEEAIACFGGATPDEFRVAADAAGVKVFAPVEVDGTTFYPAARHDRIALDDEPAELAIDGVSEQISGGAPVSGEPAVRSRELMKLAGVLK